MILRTLIFLIFANTLISEISFIDRIAIIVDEGIIMESELNKALENTVKNFEESGENRYVPRACLVDLEPGTLDVIKANPIGKTFRPDNSPNFLAFNPS